ncbi:MAG: hypothetical protein AAGB22_15375, partial [Bacteroidota bacterium]
PHHQRPVPIEKRLRQPPRIMLGAMACIIQRHDRSPRYRDTLKRTKMEKLLHLLESETGLDLGREPEKEAYGPADNLLREVATRQAAVQGYFEEVEETRPPRGEAPYPIRYYRFEPRENFRELTQEFTEAAGDQLSHIHQLLDHFLPFASQQVEIRVTVYAAWNNLLLEGIPAPDDQQIIRAAREEWHPEKLRYPVAEFQTALDWLRTTSLVPKGKGKLVVPVAV